MGEIVANLVLVNSGVLFAADGVVKASVIALCRKDIGLIS